ncbi:MAG TPA: DUF6263 family protein [Candidatus Acidoferrum sp.]|nr:DUF6263 family protein [Candidatus Acidoferrum sp.]
MCTKTRRGGYRGAASRAGGLAVRTLLCGPLILVLLLAVRPAPAETADDTYLRIYAMIDQGDALQSSGQTAQALAKYRQAQAALQTFERDHRDWNPKLIAYRSKYLADKVAALTAPAPEPAKTNAPPAPSGTEAPSTASQTRIIEPGAEPRQELRLHPKAGDKQTAAMTMKTVSDTAMSGMPAQTVKSPVINITYEATAKSVSENGDIAYDILIKTAGLADEAGVMPSLIERLKPALAGIQGLTGSGTVSAIGEGKGFEFKLPANVTPVSRALVDQMKDAFVNLSVSLPQEAVGNGAKWETKESIKSQGATIAQTSTSELSSSQPDRMVIKTTVTQSAADQKVEAPQMPGMKLKLNKLAGKGTVTTTFDLEHLLPAERVTELHSEQNVTMDAGGQPQTLVIKTDVSLRLQTK